MAARDNGWGDYKPVNRSNEEEYGPPDLKHIANIRQNSKFSEQFALDSRAVGGNVRYRDMSGVDRFRERINNIWAWEVGALLMSLGCLGVAIWFLVRFDDQLLTAWTPPISPNTFLATFITLSRTSMLVGVASGIAQLRWLYYESASRNLNELDLFDSASRGPSGAFLFLSSFTLSRGKVRVIASIGALLTILALCMDSFAQQILQYEPGFRERPDLADQTWTLTSHVYNSSVSLLDDGSTKKTVLGGLFGLDTPLTPECPSGNCTWDPFVSLGIFSTCESVTDSAVISCLDGAGKRGENCTQVVYQIPSYNLNVTLQNGSRNSVNDDPAYTLVRGKTSEPYPQGLNETTLFSFIMAQLHIDLDDDRIIKDPQSLRDPRWNISACSVDWSAKLYRGLRVDNTKFNNVAPEVLKIVSKSNSSCGMNGACQQYQIANKSAVSDDIGNTIFSVRFSDSQVDTRRLLDIDVNVTKPVNSTQLNAGQTYTILTAIFWRMDVADAMSHVTTMFTNALRQNEHGGQRITGTALVEEIYVKVKWAWFALPAALVLLSAAFLLTVIVMSTFRDGRQPVWKTSTLPLLLHGIEGWNREGYHGTEDRIAMDVKARAMRAQLRRDDMGDYMFVKSD